MVPPRKKLWLVGALLLLVGATLRAADPAATPEAVAHQAVDASLATAYTRDPVQLAIPLERRLRPVLERYFDFASVTRRSIGPGWREFSPDDRTSAVRLFTLLIVRTYAHRFTPGERPEIIYKKRIDLAPDRCELPTQVGYNGSQYSVGYRLKQTAEGWRIDDVLIEGVSFVSNYRAQFDAIFQRGGSKAVLDAIKAKLSEFN